MSVSRGNRSAPRDNDELAVDWMRRNGVPNLTGCNVGFDLVLIDGIPTEDGAAYRTLEDLRWLATQAGLI